MGGVLFVLSFGLESVVSPERDGAVTNLPFYATFNALMAVGVVLIALGLWRLRTLVGARGGRLARAADSSRGTRSRLAGRLPVDSA